MRTLLKVVAITVLSTAVPVSSALSAQTAPIVADLIKDVEGVEKKLVALANATPIEKLSWRPAAGVRSIGEVLLHVASDNYLLPFGFGVAIPAATKIDGSDFKTLTAYETRPLTRAQIVTELEASFAHLKVSMAKTAATDLTKPVTMFGMKSTAQSMWILTATHLHEHLGQSIAYARMNGIVPPWSK